MPEETVEVPCGCGCNRIAKIPVDVYDRHIRGRSPEDVFVIAKDGVHVVDVSFPEGIWGSACYAPGYSIYTIMQEEI